MYLKMSGKTKAGVSEDVQRRRTVILNMIHHSEGGKILKNIM